MRSNRFQRIQTNRTSASKTRGNKLRRSRTLELLEGRVLLAGDTVAAATPLHNALDPQDVNHDGRVSPQDALIIINDLNAHGSHSVPAATVLPLSASTVTNASSTPVAYLDVNGDNQVTPADLLRVINLLATPPEATVTLVTTDLVGNPISTIQSGSDFHLEAIVQDTRSPAAVNGGVFAAYLNATYDTNLSSIASNSPFVVGPTFSSVSIPNGLSPSHDVSTPGQINGAGVASPNFSGPGAVPQLLWTLTVHAGNGGLQNFLPSFDSTAGHDVLLFGLDTVVPSDQISFVGAQLTVTSLPTLSVSSVSKLEGNAGTTPFVFTVSLSAVAAQPVTVVYNTADVTATTADSDYVSIPSTTLTFAAGEVTKLVTVLVNGDTKTEPDEVFNLVLSNPSNNATLGTSVGVGTILNDDVTPNISINDVTVTNVTSGTTNAVFTVTLSAAATGTVNVSYATADGTATHGVNYTTTSGILTFNPGVLTQTITVPVIGNPNNDITRTFTVNLTNPVNGNLVTSTGTGTIIAAVTMPTLSVNSVSQLEGNSGFTPFIFTATLSNTSAQTVFVSYATADGTATTADSDYVAQTATLTFNPGVTQQTFTISVVGDTKVEPNETFSVNLTPGAGITQGVVQAVGTILNDDGVPTITINDQTVVNAPPGPNNAVFTVSISTAVTQALTISYATQDNTALATRDYLAQTGILTFQPGGPTSQTITVPLIPATSPQNDQTFFVNLSSLNDPTGTAVLARPQAVGTIIDQGLTLSSPSVLEGNPGDPVQAKALFTATLSKAQDHVVTVSYATADGTATLADNDYVATSGVLTFAIGVTSQVITVPIVGDTKVEPNETFFVNLSNASGIAVFTPQATGTILNDDGQKALVRLQLADTLGNPISPNATLNVSDNFVMQVYVQDIQAAPAGIASAYIDALYNSTLVSVNGPITYGAGFPNIHSGSTSTPGLIDEAGAFGNISPPAQPGAEQLLLSVPFTVLDVGLANFTAGPATLASHPVLEYGNDQPLPASTINFAGTSINIGTNVFAINSVSAPEGNSGTTPFVFTVTRFLPTSTQATVVYATSDGTATTAKGDYVAQTGTLTFAPGQLTATVTIAVNGNTINEPDETFFVGLSNPVGAQASHSPGVGTILNDDGPVGMTIADVTANEGQDFNFVVTLAAVSGNTVTVAYATADSTSGNKATAGVDYQAASGTLTFLPGVTQQTITVHSFSDIVVDPIQTFQVVLSNPVNGTLTRGQAQGNIVDVPPAVLSGNVYLDLNNNGLKDSSEAGIANVTIVATRAGSTDSQTTLTKADGSYTFVGLVPGTYTIKEIQPGFYVDGRDTHLGVDSPTNDQFSGVVLAPSASVGGYNFGEIGLRPEFVSIFFNRRAFFASALLDGSGGGPVTTTTGLNPRAGDLWVSFDGGWQGTRTIQALFDSTFGTASLTLYDNSLHIIGVSSPNATGAQLVFNGTTGSPYFLKISGTNNIVSLKVIESASINNVSQTVTGATSFVFTVTLSDPVAQAVTVAYATADGTATAASGDYVAQAGTLTFAAGVTSQPITIQITGDTNSAASETFFINLSAPTNVTLGTSKGIGTIVNGNASPGVTTTFASGASVAPAATPAAAPAVTPAASTTSTSSKAATVPMISPDPASSSKSKTTTSTDAALAEDEDWRLAALVA